MIELGSILMTLRTKGRLWNTTTRDYFPSWGLSLEFSLSLCIEYPQGKNPHLIYALSFPGIKGGLLSSVGSLANDTSFSLTTLDLSSLMMKVTWS